MSSNKESASSMNLDLDDSARRCGYYLRSGRGCGDDNVVEISWPASAKRKRALKSRNRVATKDGETGGNQADGRIKVNSGGGVAETDPNLTVIVGLPALDPVDVSKTVEPEEGKKVAQDEEGGTVDKGEGTKEGVIIDDP